MHMGRKERVWLARVGCVSAVCRRVRVWLGKLVRWWAADG